MIPGSHRASKREGSWRVRAHSVATNVMGDSEVRGPGKPSRWRKALP